MRWSIGSKRQLRQMSGAPDIIDSGGYGIVRHAVGLVVGEGDVSRKTQADLEHPTGREPARVSLLACPAVPARA